MFLDSIFSFLKANVTKKASLLALAVTGTAATGGGVASYYLFRKPNNSNKKKEKLEKINSDLEETRKNLLSRMRELKGKKFGKRLELMQKEINMKRKIDCFTKEMKSHDENIGTWGISSHQPKFNVCNNIKIDFDQQT